MGYVLKCHVNPQILDRIVQHPSTLLDLLLCINRRSNCLFKTNPSYIQ